jgi:serum/glucocorticoid-regulated kinase 2
VAGESYDHSIDLWGLGISTFELLFGTTPFEPNTMLSDDAWRATVKEHILRGVLRFPPGGRAPLAARLFVKSMLARLPSDRVYGGHGVPQYSTVKHHPFFAKLDWQALASRTLTPPPLGAPELHAPTKNLGYLGTEL